MGLKNCPDCGKLFVDNAAGICPECFIRAEKDEAKVVEFLRQKNKASLEEIHQATGVKHKVIMKMVQRGRIFQGGDVQVNYPCEICGTPIYEGRLCDKCSKNILDQVRKKEWEPPQEELPAKRRERMYSDYFRK